MKKSTFVAMVLGTVGGLLLALGMCTASLSHKKIRHAENTSIARYVWLPVEWENDKPLIRRHDEWKIEDF